MLLEKEVTRLLAKIGVANEERHDVGLRRHDRRADSDQRCGDFEPVSSAGVQCAIQGGHLLE
jgi:hypothetical protein